MYKNFADYFRDNNENVFKRISKLEGRMCETDDQMARAKTSMKLTDEHDSKLLSLLPAFEEQADKVKSLIEKAESHSYQIKESRSLIDK